MTEVSLLRLYALRACYLLLVVGLGLTVWPGIIQPETPWTLTQGVVKCMLGAMSALAVLGFLHPLKMLPLLLFEVAWKAIWLVVVAAPLWSGGRMDADTLQATYECLLVVIFVVAIPWRHVLADYLGKPGDRWRPRAGRIAAE